jgi:hypothetical protein
VKELATESSLEARETHDTRVLVTKIWKKRSIISTPMILIIGSLRSFTSQSAFQSYSLTEAYTTEPTVVFNIETKN